MVRTTTADGAPETRMVLVPAADATIVPSWDTLGLRGTGSHHIDLGEELTVPADRTFTWPTLTITRPGPLATFATHTLWLISLSAAAVNLGAARRAIAEATTSAEHKMHRFDTVPVIQQSPFIRGIAELHGQVELATAGVRALLERLWDRAVGRRHRPHQRAARAAAARRRRGDPHRRRRRPTAHLLTGADALHRAHPLERLRRDTQMLLNHVVDIPRPASSSPGPAGQLPRTARLHLATIDEGGDRRHHLVAPLEVRGVADAGEHQPLARSADAGRDEVELAGRAVRVVVALDRRAPAR